VKFSDLAIVYDHEKPTPLDPIFRSIITKDNVTYHLASILSIAQVSESVGSILIFNSPSRLNDYIIESETHYNLWPSGWTLATRQYLSKVVFNELLYEHYKLHGSIPYLNCRQFLVEWALDFYKINLPGFVPVTINLRNNKGWHHNRNSQIEAWIELFRYSEIRYPVKFIIICAFSEIDARLRTCSNVIFAKDFHTGVEQDMALINTSSMHMGAGSGPASMAWFSDKPYLMVNTSYETSAEKFLTFNDMIVEGEDNTHRFWFSNPLQRIAKGEETPRLLINQFEILFSSLDLRNWARDGDFNKKCE
jgi:hypothetical protein